MSVVSPFDDVRTKIPDPPIHFSGPTNFFGPKIDFTNHQFETSFLDPPMSSGLYPSALITGLSVCIHECTHMYSDNIKRERQEKIFRKHVCVWDREKGPACVCVCPHAHTHTHTSPRTCILVHGNSWYQCRGLCLSLPLSPSLSPFSLSLSLTTHTHCLTHTDSRVHTHTHTHTHTRE